jgi:HTH-type transcriptional regulator, sugar sensing transcriptional regulator
VDEIEKFKLLPFDFRQITTEFKNSIDSIVIDDTHYSEELFIIADGKESIDVHSAGNKREAVVVRLPIVCHIQKIVHSEFLEPGIIKNNREVGF